MKTLFLILAVLAVFAVAYFAVDRFGRFLEASCLARRGEAPDPRKVYFSTVAGKSIEQLSDEIDRIMDSHAGYEIVVCSAADPVIADCLSQGGCAVEYGR